jgi:hypothetical protein
MRFEVVPDAMFPDRPQMLGTVAFVIDPACLFKSFLVGNR